jgi:hypothetical protein
MEQEPAGQEVHNNTDTSGGLFEHVPASLMKLFTGKKQNFQSWDYSPQMPDSELSD